MIFHRKLGNRNTNLDFFFKSDSLTSFLVILEVFPARRKWIQLTGSSSRTLTRWRCWVRFRWWASRGTRYSCPARLQKDDTENYSRMFCANSIQKVYIFLSFCHKHHSDIGNGAIETSVKSLEEVCLILRSGFWQIQLRGHCSGFATEENKVLGWTTENTPNWTTAWWCIHTCVDFSRRSKKLQFFCQVWTHLQTLIQMPLTLCVWFLYGKTGGQLKPDSHFLDFLAARKIPASVNTS